MAGETDADKKQSLNRQKIRLQSAHPGFSSEILEYNTITNSCRVAGFIPFAAPVTTQAFVWENHIIIPCGEVKAGVRTASILMGNVKSMQ
jgi:N-acetylneuraminic acid mutarotase